jgi:hypothetical protein
MRVIINESQYNELNKVDDVYDNLKPYFRRRVKFIDIPKAIDDMLNNAHRFYHNEPSSSYLTKSIVRNVVWETIPIEWGSSDDFENINNYLSIMSANIMDKYGENIKRLVRKKLDK